MPMSMSDYATANKNPPLAKNSNNAPIPVLATRQITATTAITARDFTAAVAKDSASNLSSSLSFIVIVKS